jgi:very-short-patch-repair endonuclease
MLGVRSLRRVVERAAVCGILDVAAAEHIMATSRRRGAPSLRRLLSGWQPTDSTDEIHDGGPDLRSELEARLLLLINAAELPTPHCNHPVEISHERFVVDFLWPEHQLVVETDGKRFHDNPIAFERDRRRDRALQLSGYRVVRFTYRQLEDEPGEVIAAIDRLLKASIG